MSQSRGRPGLEARDLRYGSEILETDRGTGTCLGGMRTWWFACLFTLLALPALGRPAAATHAPDHRFIVLGFVTDAEGRPRAGVPVVVTRVKTGLRHPTRTEADGLYVVVVHLHDEDQGESLAVSADGATTTVVARFDVRNKRFERGTRLDVRGGTAVEDPGGFAETLRAYLSR